MPHARTAMLGLTMKKMRFISGQLNSTQRGLSSWSVTILVCLAGYQDWLRCCPQTPSMSQRTGWVVGASTTTDKKNFTLVSHVRACVNICSRNTIFKHSQRFRMSFLCWCEVAPHDSCHLDCHFTLTTRCQIIGPQSIILGISGRVTL